uniref:cilia- and flagella-associated protein 100 isoform X2 n=1 Tax=Semicossyphus pulcher TaxID=241346 RepID=UPI0037E9621F
MDNFAMPGDKKMTHDARMRVRLKNSLVGLEEEEEEKEKLKQEPCSYKMKIAMMKRENLIKDSKHDLVSMERQKAVLELSLMTKKLEIFRMDKAIAKEESQLKELEMIIERDNLKFEEVLRENEKKSVEARTFFELEAKSKQEKNVKIKKLTAEIGSIISELAKFEEILIDYKRYKELLFKLSPLEWQQAQKTKPLKVLSNINALDEQNSESEESAIWNGLESKVSCPGRELPSIRETKLPSALSSTLIISSALESNSSESKNSSRLVETLEEFQLTMETTKKKIEKDEKQLTLQINDMNQSIDKEKARGTKLNQKVQLHVSLNTEDQDVMFETLDEKVAEVHHCCVDNSLTNFSTLEKLANIENRISLLLQSLESIPGESLGMMRKIKDSERRSRYRDKRLEEQRQKMKERMRRYLEKSLADSKKISTRKLMPRCMPVAQKVRVSNVDNTPSEDEIHAFLFTTEDID